MSEKVEGHLNCAILLQGFQKMTFIFCGRYSTLETLVFIFRRVVLCAFANRIVMAASCGDNMQIAWQVWDIVRVPFCLTGAVFGEDPSRVECHFAVMSPSSFLPFCVASAVLGDIATCH